MAADSRLLSGIEAAAAIMEFVFRLDLPGHVVGQPALLRRLLTIDPVGSPRGGGQLQTRKPLCRDVPSCIRSCRGLSGLIALDPHSAFQQQVLITTGLFFFVCLFFP